MKKFNERIAPPSKELNRNFCSNLSKSQENTELIPLIVEGENILVDARILHMRLDVKTRFDTWIQRRIEEYGFENGKDFCTNLFKSTGGRRATEYILTMDMAKELAMVEQNETGRTVRRYFIEIEKQCIGWVGYMLPRLEKDIDLFGERLGYNYLQLLKSVELKTDSGAANSRKYRNPQEFWKNQSGITFVSEAYSKNIISYAAVKKLSRETKLRRISFESQLALQGGVQ